MIISDIKMMGYNKVYHCNFLENRLPNKCANLIIADPPYFEVKGDFDFVWKDFNEYLKDVELWAQECKRILADNGTLFWYGHAKKIAYSQIILDRFFNIENSIAIEFNRQTKKGVFDFRCFAPVSERLLMYSNEVTKTGLQEIYDNPDCFKPIKLYMRAERDKLIEEKGFKTIEQFNQFINNWTNTSSVVSRHYFADSQYTFPTEIIYKKMQETGYWQKEYEALRQEYEALRRPFNNFMGLFDIMRFDQEAHITKNYDHDTVKPETLTRTLILTCSRPNDLVVVPFSGSGTEHAMAIKEGRRSVAFDIEKKYVDMSNKRAMVHLAQPYLF